jgi:hypothetical protein
MPIFDPTEVELVQPPQEGGDGPGPSGGEPKPPGDGPQKPPGDSPAPPGDQPEIDIDQIQKEVEEKLAKREEIETEEQLKAKQEKADAKRPQMAPPHTGQPGKGGMSDMENIEAEILRFKPKFSWKALIKQLVSSAVPQTDVTYAKPSRRAVTGVAMAAQTGAGALKPGERVQEENKAKLVFVFDTSGSMHSEIPRVLAEVRNMLKQLGKSNVELGVVFYADGYETFVVNMVQDWYVQVPHIRSVMEPTDKKSHKKGWKSVFGMAATGGTTFSATMAQSLKELAQDGYNILVFSDADMLAPENFVNLKDLYQTHKAHTFFVGTNEFTFKKACEILGQVPRTFTYLT